MKPRSTREKYITRKILLGAERQRDTLLALVQHLPIDPIRPLEIVVREEVKARKMDQNALMWVGPLADMAEQAWIENRKFSAEVWHEFLKKEFLPEEFDPELCKEGYAKWDFDPAGDRVMVGSTTQLTIKGFSQYLEQVFAFGANLGVQFHANPNEVPMLGNFDDQTRR